MPSINKKSASINDQSAQLQRLNANSIEILTKLDQSLNSNDSFITIDLVDQTGKKTSAQFPTIGYFKQELDAIKKSLNLLAGFDSNGSAIQIADSAYKRIITADLNLEPKQINGLQPVTVFKTNPNWIFDSFLNPKISIEIDLTGKIENGIKTVQSRRFIVVFEQQVTQDSSGNDVVTLTTLGQQRKSEFETLFKGKSNVDMVQFVTWLDSPGLVNRTDDNLIDEDHFRVEPNRLQFKGSFAVTGTDIDTVNKKMWYLLDTLTYFDVSDVTSPAKPVTLKVGDLVNVNPNLAGVVSTTVYKVIEISTITSDFRVRFEQVFGEEPIPVRLSALAYYSNTVPSRKVRVSIGFDEYCVCFVRSVDDMNNLIGKDWSPGIGFWTNELKFDNDAGQVFNDYYAQHVYDYGIILEDLVQKKVPNFYALKPNAPILDAANFKVVQSNSYLTDTVDAEQIRDLHNTKNTLTSEIVQIQGAIDNQNRMLATAQFDSQAERKQAQDQLNSLQSKLQTKNATKVSTISNILASQKNVNKISPEFKLRGFWPMPDPVTSTKTLPQEVVQFEVWFKKVNKSGAENPIATFQNISNSAAKLSAAENTTVNQNLSQPKSLNASFSNWQSFKTDARKRVQDPISGQWKWEIVDVSNADTPNINQLDLDIMPGDVVQFKVKSLSEAGYPETPAESDFSNILEMPFPDDLNSVLSDDQFILSSASADDIKVKLDSDLDAKGLTNHLSSSVTVENVYYPHSSVNIISGFRDNSGKLINMFDYLNYLVGRISTLEETVARGKGVLDLYIVYRGNRTKVYNGNTLTFNINLEDYMQVTKIGLQNNPKDAPNSRTYLNNVTSINDYALQIVNSAADSPLGLLSNRNYGQINGAQPSTFAYKYDALGSTPQAIWIDKQNTVLGQINILTDAQAPKFSSQVNNQWLWQQVQDVSGNDIYTDVYDEVAGTSPASWTDWSDFTNLSGISNKQVLTFINPDRNSGMLRNLTGVQNNENGGSLLNASGNGSNLPIGYDISQQKRWTVAVPSVARTYSAYFFDARYSRNDMATTICPQINSFSDITDTSAQQTKLLQTGDSNAVTIPLKILYKTYTGTQVFSTAFPTQTFVETSDLSSSGDMPLIDSTANYTATAGKLTIPFLVNMHHLQVGDKIVITGLAALGATNGLYNADSVPLKIVTAGATSITVDYNVATGFSQATTGTAIAQVHLRSKKSSGSAELAQYCVYGTLPSQDVPFVRSYVEISASNTAPTPQVHNKKIRFYMESEQSLRPIDIQFTFNITQYRKITNAQNTVINQTNNNINQQ